MTCIEIFAKANIDEYLIHGIRIKVFVDGIIICKHKMQANMLEDDIIKLHGFIRDFCFSKKNNEAEEIDCYEFKYKNHWFGFYHFWKKIDV